MQKYTLTKVKELNNRSTLINLDEPVTGTIVPDTLKEGKSLQFDHSIRLRRITSIIVKIDTLHDGYRVQTLNSVYYLRLIES